MESAQETAVESASAEGVNIGSLNDDVMLEIFRYIPSEELYSVVNKVCRRWRNLCKHATLLHNISLRDIHHWDPGYMVNFFRKLKFIREIHSLDVNDEFYGKRLVNSIARSNASVEHLHLNIFSCMNNLPTVIYNSKNLKTLNVSCAININDILVSVAQSCHSLTMLDISDTVIDNPKLLHDVADNCPKIEKLNLFGIDIEKSYNFSVFDLVIKLRKLKYLYSNVNTGVNLFSSLITDNLPFSKLSTSLFFNFEHEQCYFNFENPEPFKSSINSVLPEDLKHYYFGGCLEQDRSSLSYSVYRFRLGEGCGVTCYLHSGCEFCSNYAYIKLKDFKVLSYEAASNLSKEHVLSVLTTSNLSKLHTLSFKSCTYVDDVIIDVVANRCPNLMFLNVDGCTLVSYESLKRVDEMCSNLNIFGHSEFSECHPEKNVLDWD